MQPRAAKARVLLQCLYDEWLVRIEHGRAPGFDTIAEARGLESARDRVWMKTQLSHDRADLPVLAEVQLPNPRVLFGCDRHRHLSLCKRSAMCSWRRSLKSPRTPRLSRVRIASR